MRWSAAAASTWWKADGAAPEKFDDPLEKTPELRMRFVSKYMTIEVGSTLFEDLNYLLMYLTILLFGIAIVYGWFKRTPQQVDPLPPAPAVSTMNEIEAEQVRGDLRRETYADPRGRTIANADAVPEPIGQEHSVETDDERRRRMQIHIHGRATPPVTTWITGMCVCGDDGPHFCRNGLLTPAERATGYCGPCSGDRGCVCECAGCSVYYEQSPAPSRASSSPTATPTVTNGRPGAFNPGGAP
jgi:hypothetical protein